MYVIKYILGFFICIFALNFFADWIAHIIEMMGVPATGMDVIISSVSCIALYYWPKLNLKNYVSEYVMTLSIIRFIAYIMSLLFFVLFGVLFIYLGFKYPFEFMDSSRGGGSYSYSLGLMGFAFFLYSTEFLYLVTIRRWQWNKEKIKKSKRK